MSEGSTRMPFAELAEASGTVIDTTAAVTRASFATRRTD
jgi:hypothetical protein